MFSIESSKDFGLRRFAVGLAVLSFVSLSITAWIMMHMYREDQIFAKIVSHLPRGDASVASELTRDLKLDRALIVLLVINLVGTTIAVMAVIRAYMVSQRSLRDVKVFATDILASMDAGVLTTDHLGNITSANPRSRELLGIDDNMLGRPLVSLGSEHDTLSRICEQVRCDHKPIRDQDYSLWVNNHRQTILAGCSLLRDRTHEAIGTVLQVRNVTERVLIEDRLRRMERYMGLGSLSAGLQHELKNPLSALSLHVQLLGEQLDRDPTCSTVGETLDVLYTEIHRINEVLDGFRNYASISEIGRSPVDVSQLISKQVRLLRPQAQQQAVEIQVDLPDQTADFILADSPRLEQALLNLALNALRAMPDGGTLTFRVYQDQGQCCIAVCDTGGGIPAEIQSRIFDPYFTTHSDGTGMGLALCDKIVQQHDGSIDLQTGPTGTCFTLSFPIMEQEPVEMV